MLGDYEIIKLALGSYATAAGDSQLQPLTHLGLICMASVFSLLLAALLVEPTTIYLPPY